MNGWFDRAQFHRAYMKGEVAYLGTMRKAFPRATCLAFGYSKQIPNQYRPLLYNREAIQDGGRGHL